MEEAIGTSVVATPLLMLLLLLLLPPVFTLESWGGVAAAGTDGVPVDNKPAGSALPSARTSRATMDKGAVAAAAEVEAELAALTPFPPSTAPAAAAAELGGAGK